MSCYTRSLRTKTPRLLREVEPLIPTSPAAIIGIDDWAYKRRRRYATLICDWEDYYALIVWQIETKLDELVVLLATYTYRCYYCCVRSCTYLEKGD